MNDMIKLPCFCKLCKGEENIVKDGIYPQCKFAQEHLERMKQLYGRSTCSVRAWKKCKMCFRKILHPIEIQDLPERPPNKIDHLYCIHKITMDQNYYILKPTLIDSFLNVTFLRCVVCREKLDKSIRDKCETCYNGDHKEPKKLARYYCRDCDMWSYDDKCSNRCEKPHWLIKHEEKIGFNAEPL